MNLKIVVVATVLASSSYTLAHAQDAETALTETRSREVQSYFLNQANKKGTPISAALSSARSLPEGLPANLQVANLKMIEFSEDVCADPKNSEESREFLIALTYLDHRERNSNADGGYQSNTAAYRSVIFTCELSAEGYGSPRYHVVCASK